MSSMQAPLVKNDCAVYGMWQGERICEILGYTKGHKWTKETMLHYLETLVSVHDKWIESQGHYSVDFESIEPLDLSSVPNTKLHRWKLIRDAVSELSAQFPTVEVADIIAKLGVSIEEFQRAVSVNKCKTIMSESGFRSFSIACLSDKPNFAGIGRQYGTGVNTMKFYKKLFRKIKEQQGQVIDRD